MKIAHHLAPIAHPQAEGVGAGEERRELGAGAGVEQHALGPALAGSQDVAVAEAAAGGEPPHVAERHAAGRMSVMCTSTARNPARVKAAAISTSPFTPCSRRMATAGRVPVRSKAGAASSKVSRGVMPGSSRSSLSWYSGLGAGGMVAQERDAPGDIRPHRPQVRQVLVEQDRFGLQHTEPVVAPGRAQSGGYTSAGPLVEHGEHRHQVGCADLDHGAEFLGEQGSERAFRSGVGGGRQVDLDPGVSGEGHFRQRGQQPAIGPVVVGEQKPVPVEPLDRIPEGLQVLRTVDVRRGLSGLRQHLREDRAAEPILAPAQVDQQQDGRAVVRRGTGGELRRKGFSDILAGGEGGDDERDRCGHAPRLAAVAPDRAHAHGVLADRDGDAERRAEFHAHGAHGGVEFGAFARQRGRGHPVGGQVDAAQMPIRAATRLVRASPTASRAEAAALLTATGVRSPMAMASPVYTSKDAAVTAQSATGTCHGSHHLVARDEPGDRAVSDRDEKRLVRHGGVDEHAAHRLGQRQAADRERRERADSRRVSFRCMRGGLPSSTSSGRSIGRFWKCRSSSTSVSPRWPHRRRQTDTRSRSQSWRKRSSRRPAPRARSAPGIRCTRFRAGSGPVRRWARRAIETARPARRR
jgi:hypothetical protein